MKNKMIGLVWLGCCWAPLAIIYGCYVGTTGTTHHRVEGEAEIKITIDFSICDSLTTNDAKLECIQAITHLITESQKEKEIQK